MRLPQVSGIKHVKESRDIFLQSKSHEVNSCTVYSAFAQLVYSLIWQHLVIVWSVYKGGQTFAAKRSPAFRYKKLLLSFWAFSYGN